MNSFLIPSGAVSANTRQKQGESMKTSATAPGEQPTILTLNKVGKSFGNLRVLKGIDLQVQRSEVVCLIGPSGSGKSTLLRSMAFLEEYDEGEIHIEGQLLGWQDTDKGRRRAPQAQINQVRRNVGMVFQQFNLWPHMTAIGNVCEALRRVRKLSADEANTRGMAMLDKVGLAHKAPAYPAQLSGGQQQRVAIARALVGDPPLILADEPTGNLDTQTSDDIMRGLQKLNSERGITIVLVTHEPDIAAWSRRLVRLKDGRVLYDGPSAEGLRQLSASHDLAAAGSDA